MTVRGERYWGCLLPILLGALAFLLVIGPRVLDPTNIAWLGEGDTTTHYLGWAFFRSSPWTFPLGMNPSYGLELGNGIIFSDSNPLLAFLFKPFSGWLPETFQYFGLWLLACFILQAWFAWKLLGLLTPSLWIRLLGAGLFVFSPPMFLRMGAHLSLSGHFLILAALYLALRPGLQKRRLAWGVLLAATALVHAYLLAMVALIWLADLANQAIKGRLFRRDALIELSGLFLLVAFCCWQAGYFSVGGGTVSGGYGLYRLNVLSLVDPSGWSYIVRDLPEGPGDYEGFNYLGLGVLILAICAAAALLQGNTGLVSAVRHRWLLLWALFGLTLFSLTNTLGIGVLDVHYWLPGSLEKLANVFRASGRMFWPVFYAIVFAVIFLVIRGNKPRAAACLLAIALLVQVLDTRAGWAGLRQSRMMPAASSWSTSMNDPFWASAASHYSKVRLLLPQNQPDNWLLTSQYALKHGLETDGVYLGRMGTREIEQAQRRAAQMLASGEYAADSLYILDPGAALQAAKTVNRQTDLLTRIDGLVVLAPGWKSCAQCPSFADETLDVQVKIGERQVFSRINPMLASGWGRVEDWGIWSEGTEAEIVLRIAPEARVLSIDAAAFVQPPLHTRQRVDVSINGVAALSTQFTRLQDNTLELPLTPAIRETMGTNGSLRVHFHLPDAISPKALGLGGDERVMALGLKSLIVR
ncbi:hypothetical protein SAMN03159382_01022 [Pseudomonas sp. NFACC23-1]|uniref:DUF6311 domain-containing protein n=1 Tax=unclassified Pseudomonas TaxID=196821 RepID=UPI0008872D0F|nr:MULTISPECIES: DUF6311 domain-containing protein [unclassified Pseudomonas]SDB43189.1 hypothetical protein SAMN03159386_03165 [Pseudomonas sp. NFACC17-2]SEJ06982.1 hypothetical protein SAMN03159382_01022 [Pseudomonas sp. NFACC23-1]SFW41906.1 hypothetical protein SAMN05660640_01304 [Pseudomonas sp. NFACC16-2]